MFDITQKNNKILVNFADFDISTNKNRVISEAYPITINNKFIGTMFIESDLKNTMSETIIPKSSKYYKIPFI